VLYSSLLATNAGRTLLPDLSLKSIRTRTTSPRLYTTPGLNPLAGRRQRRPRSPSLS
jgi:hypothetical protein